MRRIHRNIYIAIPFNELEDMKGTDFCYFTGKIIINSTLDLPNIDLSKDLVITFTKQLQDIKKFKFVNTYNAVCDQVEYIINTW